VRLYQQGGASTSQRLPSFSLSQRASWCLCIIRKNLRHRTVCTSTQLFMHPPKHNRFTALWTLSRTTRVSRYQKKHSPTHTYRGHQSSLICFIHLLRSIASSCSIHAPDTLFPQSLSKFSLVYLLPGTFILHIFLHPITVFFSQHMPIETQSVTRRRSESAHIRQVHDNVMMYTSTRLYKHLPMYLRSRRDACQ